MTHKKVSGGGKETKTRMSGLVSFLSRIKKSDRTTKMFFGSVVLACAVMVVVVVAIVTQPPTLNSTPVGVIPIFRHPLTGAVIDAPMQSLPQVFAVMIENSADAWPLAGLQDAFLVIEAPVEAGIPRFEAFFSDDAATEKIGPVRSARPYYLDWASEFDAVYAHVGGSPEALDLIPSMSLTDCNEFFNGTYFYRWSARYAPHNVYTTMRELLLFANNADLETPHYDSWQFKSDAAGDDAQSLSLDWSSGTTYDVDWNYDAITNAYVRDQRGVNVFLEKGEQTRANNVAVMESDIEIVDEMGRRHIRTIGEGRAMIAQDGRVIFGTWKKASQAERLRFYDEAGNEMMMNAGKTWVEVVSSLGQVRVTSRRVASKE